MAGDPVGEEPHGLLVGESGNRLAVHANGDRAIELVLDEFEAAAARWPRPGIRHRIEHCSITNDRIVSRMRELGAIAVPFGGYVGFHGEKLVRWYGAERLERMFAHRSFLAGGVAVAGSSDYPCGPFEPLTAMQSCVTRQGPDGRVLGGSQRISALDALKVYTVGSAIASGKSNVKAGWHRETSSTSPSCPTTP